MSIDNFREREHWKQLRESRQFLSMATPKLQVPFHMPVKGQVKPTKNTKLEENSYLRHEISAFEGPTLSPRKSECKKQGQNYLQESFEKELSKVKKATEYNDTSSLFSNNTDNDSTIKFISILDKINENQIKKNKFYSEIIKDIDFEHQTMQGQLCSSDKKKLEECYDMPSFDDSVRFVSKTDRVRSAQTSNRTPQQDDHPGDASYMVKLKGGSPANLRPSGGVNNIDHLLELHQPNQHEIIFECSKEWTVNQTPDMREKDMMPQHLALHFERMRQDAIDAVEALPQLKASIDTKDRHSHQTSRVYRLNCQKELFTASPQADNVSVDPMPASSGRHSAS